jgi:hypothetical protein
MRTTMTFLLAAATLAGCNWATFDDLADETWAHSTGKPDKEKAADWGVAIQRGAASSESGASGRLAVIGAGAASYSELSYDETGSSSASVNSIALGQQGIMTLDSPAILLASPVSSEVSLVTSGNSGSIVVASGEHTLAVRQLFTTTTSLGNSVTIGVKPDAAVYMQPAEFASLPGIVPAPAPLVAVADIVLGTIVGLPSGTPQPACKLVDGSNQVQIRALGAVTAGAGPTDDVLVWNGADGRLLRYPGSVFNGCVTAAPLFQPDLALKPAFRPSVGSQILKIDATRVLLQGHQDPNTGSGGFLQIFNSDTLAPIGNAVTTEGVRSAAILDTGTAQYVVAGYPTATVNTKKTGQVLIFRIGASGLETTQAGALYDAQPEDNQSFGRSVTVMPYRGKNVIAVSADNEVFVYFQARLQDGSELYGETRQVQ